MEQYIPKAALVAEIEKCIDRCNEKKRSCPVNTQVEAICDNKINAYNEVLSSLNTIEAKDVEELDINEVCRFLDGYSFIPTYVINELRNEFSKRK